MNYPESMLNTGNFTAELETNDIKKRAGIYIRNDVVYKRRNDLEKQNLHVVIIDVTAFKDFRIINLYRSFRPQGGVSTHDFFQAQLGVINNAVTKNCITNVA